MIQLSPKEKRQQRTQQAILDAARQLVHEKGIDGLSMRAIAERIDYSPAGLYEYYGSKEEIIAAVCRQGFQRFAHYLQSVDKTLRAEEYMVEMGLAYIDFALQNSDFFLLMFTTAPLQVQEFQNVNSPKPLEHLAEDDAFTLLVRGVERCVQEGLFHPQPGYGVLEMARTAWGLVHGVAMLQLSLMQNIPFEREAIRTALRALFRGMKAL